MSPFTAADVTVAIPTYARGRVLVDTLRLLLHQDPPAGEILVVDQTDRHEPEIEAALGAWEAVGAVRRLRLPRPSIPVAMNAALLQASLPIVLFLDDDVVPAEGLIGTHAASFREASIWAVAGQVLQPGEEPAELGALGPRTGLRADFHFPFRSVREEWVTNVMAGNLAVRRDRAREVGGFDERFVGVAFRFETEFARRLGGRGGRILFQPAASVRHLRVDSGGTRSGGGHLTSASGRHGVGDYYFALRHGLGPETMRHLLARPFREVRTRFHLRHPWWIPIKLVGELRALLLATRLARAGPRLIAKSALPTTSGAVGRDGSTREVTVEPLEK